MELWNEIDLTRHGVIEAHAGTGKTFTIVKIVLRILETAAPDRRGGIRRIHLRELLLVTFTEKAAGELKKRIREGLEERIARLHHENTPRCGPLIDHLENCLNNLHEALIGTIHAVCLRLLQNRPFESGMHFDMEMVDDGEGLATCLREAMRSSWQVSDTRIAGLLTILAESGTRLTGKHFSLILHTARELLDSKHSTLYRSVPPPDDLSLTREELLRLRVQKETSWPAFREMAGALAEQLETADKAGLIDEKKKESLIRRCAELRKIHAGYQPKRSMFTDPLKVGTSRIFTQLNLKKTPALQPAEDSGNLLANHPFITASTALDTLLHQLLLTLVEDTAVQLATRWNNSKRTSGQISFLDMLSRMHDAVCDNPSFAASLRERLRYAIIDEFQDTSPTQWAIFRRLFLDANESESPRLFIVGDPKQSIYRFQGANVDSYLDARSAIQAAGGAHYALLENFRSYESLINGYNAVFTSQLQGGGWFLSGSDHRGIEYHPGDAVTAHRRESVPEHPYEGPALQVIPLYGTAPQRTRAMAEHAAAAIRHLIGRTISLPDGSGWKDCLLGYEHFAVIVEKHSLAEPFLEVFRCCGIPAVKYKMEGVFQSPMAGALLAIFNAIITPGGNPAPRIAALLTHFFNRKPEAINPDRDIEPCPDAACRGENLCIAHALQEWTGLAGQNRWARLFESIQDRTGIRERLIRLIDGERLLADLRQLIEYCIGKLYAERFTLRRLAEHLDRAAGDDSVVDREADLHVLATQKSSVKVLTVHAAKGLEFPVVFAVSGTSKTRLSQSSGSIRWDSEQHPGSESARTTNITPYLSTKDIDFDIDGSTPKARCLEQLRRERRRLLYVALTRAQALLFVPLQLKDRPETAAPGFNWRECDLPTYADDDLTPVLLTLLDQDPAIRSIGLRQNVGLAEKDPGTGHSQVLSPQVAIAPCPDPVSLNLASRVCRQTSYSQLSRESAPARSVDKSEEVDDELPHATAVPSPLPGGRQTGDALHAAIEEILGAADTAVIAHDTGRLSPIVEKYLDANGILSSLKHATSGALSADPVQAAITTACIFIKGALTSRIAIPGGNTIIISQLPKTDCTAEMEFLFPAGRHWVHGFMDLVFRIPIPRQTAHPWRYFVLDWKSDTLASYDAAALDQCMEKRHYYLQSRLYCHALDRFLRHTLREDYHPERHLGGAVYVFLRGFGDATAAAPVLVNEARPVGDREFVDDLISRKDTGTHGT